MTLKDLEVIARDLGGRVEPREGVWIDVFPPAEHQWVRWRLDCIPVRRGGSVVSDGDFFCFIAMRGVTRKVRPF